MELGWNTARPDAGADGTLPTEISIVVETRRLHSEPPGYECNRDVSPTAASFEAELHVYATSVGIDPAETQFLWTGQSHSSLGIFGMYLAPRTSARRPSSVPEDRRSVHLECDQSRYSAYYLEKELSCSKGLN